MPQPILETDRVTKRYRELPVVDAVSLALAPGEILCLFGPNGAGKTTLIRMAATLIRPTSGALRFRGVPTREAIPRARGWIGFASHQSLLYPELTVAENLRFHARLHGGATDIGALLSEHQLTAFADVPARHLSRGAAQRTSLARALLHEPELLLLDEPFSGLDRPAADRLAGFILAARERGAAVLAATHDVERGLEIADRSAVLHRGRVILDDPKADPATVREAYREAASGQTSQTLGRGNA